MTKRKANYGGKSRGIGAGRSQVTSGERKRNPRLRQINGATPRKELPFWLRVLLYAVAGIGLGILGATIAHALG